MQDPSAPATLVAKSWLPSGDATAGVSWAFASSYVGEHPLVWRVTAEAGYAWTADMGLALSPDLPSSDPRRVATTDVGTLSLSGGFGRVGLAVGF